MIDDIDPVDREWALLVRYFAGDATPAERSEIERRAPADPGWNEEISLLRNLWEEVALTPTSARIDTMWESLSAEIDTRENPGAVGNPAVAPIGRSSARPRPSRSLRVALAAAAVVAGLTVTVPLWMESLPTTSAVLIPREYRTERGQLARLRLVDGTSVHLGPESSLTIRTPFRAGRPRELELHGEAVFEVVHDERRPFRVYAAQAVTEDLGTRFSVRSYPEDSHVRVVVAEGLVAVRSRNAPTQSDTVLGPGQLGTVGKTGRTRVASGIDPNEYLGWARGRVVFRQARIGQIEIDLERAYNIDIDFPESMSDQELTLDMPADDLAAVLSAVVTPLGLRYEERGGKIEIRPIR